MQVVRWYGSGEPWRSLKVIESSVSVVTLWKLLVNWKIRVGYVGHKFKNLTARESP